MTELLDEVLTAHGGAERWQSISSTTARGRLDGLLPKRFSGNKLANFTFQVQGAEQHTVLHDFPQIGQRAVFDRAACGSKPKTATNSTPEPTHVRPSSG